MNRRRFAKIATKTLLLILTAGNALFLAGCSVWSDILAWIPIGEAALNSILALLSANGVAIGPALQAIVTLIETAFNDLTAAVKEYQSTTPPPVGALVKVQAAFKALTDQFSNFLAQLGVSGGLLSVIAGIAQIVFSTIAAFVNQLPTTAQLTQRSTVQVGSKSFPVVAKKRSVSQFKHDVNAVVDAGKAVGLNCPPNAYL